MGSYTSWQEKAAKEVKNRQKSSDPKLYTPQDLSQRNFTHSFPGEPPYTRGARASMYCGRPWTIRQYAGFSTASESNKFFRENLAAGQKGLSVAFDLPTHRGFDSDHPRVQGDVGLAGVAIDSVEDMKVLFADIPLNKMSVSMTMNGAVLPVLAAFIVAAQESGVAAKELSGTIQNDILKEYMVRNTYIYPPEPSLRIVGDIMEFCSQECPSFNSISISGYHMQEAGATPDLELAYTIADGLEYVDLALRRGLHIDKFAPRLSFFFGIGLDFFTEIAKLRAARQLWYEKMQAFNPQDPRSSILRTHCQTSGYSLTAQDPHNNIIRTTIEALAAVLGGTQSLHTNALDEAIALPTEFSALVARNTQLILQEECGLTEVIDPLGGSYFIESLTLDLKNQAEKLIAEIQDSGGMAAAIAAGIPKRRIEAAAAKKQARLDRGLDVLVGVNKYVRQQPETAEARSIDLAAVSEAQRQNLQKVKEKRSKDRVAQALNRLKRDAESGANLMPAMLEAMSCRVTVGESSQALAEVFGYHQEASSGIRTVYAGVMENESEFLAVCERVKNLATRIGRQPRILVTKLGQDGHDRGAKVIASGFADCGFDVDLGSLFQTPAEAARQAIENDVHVLGISSQAAGHRLLLPELAKELKKRGAEDIILVVGGIIPEQDHDFLLKNGVTAIFGPGRAVHSCAAEILSFLETLSYPSQPLEHK